MLLARFIDHRGPPFFMCPQITDLHPPSMTPVSVAKVSDGYRVDSARFA